MESFQPGLNFNPVKRAEIVSQLHGKSDQPALNFQLKQG
jgi:hypothetical protein